jgi:hypothetical protein
MMGAEEWRISSLLRSDKQRAGDLTRLTRTEEHTTMEYITIKQSCSAIFLRDISIIDLLAPFDLPFTHHEL